MERRYVAFFFLVPLVLLLGIFLIYPLALVFIESVSIDGHISLANYLMLFTKNLYRESLGTSLALSFSTAILGTVIGLPLSYIVYKSQGRFRQFLMALTAVPLTFSGLVIGFMFIILLGTSGFITMIFSQIFGFNPLEFSAFLFTWRGLVVAYLYFLIPRMILTMTAAWSNADWSLIEAAMNLGASRMTILFKVLLPMLGPAIFAGSSLLFAVSMGAFGTAFALTGTGVKILPLVIYTHISEVSVDIGRADALAVVLAVVTTVVITLYERLFASKGR
ncbi:MULTISPECIES: ABC transporter permease subunit [Aminobacterium]|mgnify:CR=1 FL=1|uniref:ABC transporter permease subunit n=1 Tax=Aminobacterium TaxID=81466 RepID=UPI0004630BD1|nr:MULTISPECIES: ABC transporter permease subunit [Aminobacterium]